MPVLAQYLGFVSLYLLILHLYHLQPEPVRQVFEDFAISKANWSRLPKKPNLTVNGVLTRAFTRSFARSFGSISPQIPILLDSSRIDERSAYDTYIICMHRMLLADPNRFAAEPRDPSTISFHNPGNPGFEDEVRDQSARRNGYTPEDWNRAYQLLRAYAWYNNPCYILAFAWYRCAMYYTIYLLPDEPIRRLIIEDDQNRTQTQSLLSVDYTRNMALEPRQTTRPNKDSSPVDQASPEVIPETERRLCGKENWVNTRSLISMDNMPDLTIGSMARKTNSLGFDLISDYQDLREVALKKRGRNLRDGEELSAPISKKQRRQQTKA